MNSTLKSLLFWMALVVVGVVIWNVSTKLQQNQTPLSFSEFMASVEAGNIEKVEITGQEITGTNKSQESFHTYVPDAVRRAGEQADRPRRHRPGEGARRSARGRRCSTPGRRSCS